jgi:uncharacterized protein (TIGR00369 family)
MQLQELFDTMPFARHVGVEITDAGDGTASGHIELDRVHSSSPERFVSHGGVPYTLADTVGGAAVMSIAGRPTPTIDMRIDYLAPANGDRIEANAEVVRYGGSVAAVDVTVTDGAGERIATARGVYKTGGGDGETAWEGPQELDD